MTDDTGDTPDTPFDAEAEAEALCDAMDANWMHREETVAREHLQRAYDAGEKARLAQMIADNAARAEAAQPSTPPDADILRAHEEMALRNGNRIVPANTVEVRIAVAVAEDGDWAASGWSGHPDGDCADNAMDCLDDGARVSYVTARVPLPTKPAEIEGTVSDE